MDESSRLARNTLWLGVAQALRFVTSAVLMILIPRGLPDVAEYGRLSLAMSLCGIFSVLVDFGFSEITVRDIPRDRSLTEPYLFNILGLKIVVSTIVYGLIALTCLALGYPPVTSGVVLLIGGFTIANSFSVTLNQQFRALERMDYEARAVAVQNALIAAFVLVALYLAHDIVFVAGGYLVASVLSLAATMAMYRLKGGPLGLRFDLHRWSDLLGRAWYFALSNFVLLIYLQIDVVMLQRILRDDTEVGYYQAAVRLMIVAVFPATVLIAAAVPLLSRLFGEGSDRFREMAIRLGHVVQAVTIPLALVICIFSRELLGRLLGERYAEAYQMLSWLAIAALIRYLGPYRLLLSVTGYQRVVFWGSAASAVLNIVLNFWLIPEYGGWGAAVATLITNVFVTVVFAVWSYRRLGVQALTFSTAVMLTGGALLVQLMYSEQLRFGLFPTIAAFLLIYGAFVWMMTFSAEERRLMVRTLRRAVGLKVRNNTV